MDHSRRRDGRRTESTTDGRSTTRRRLLRTGAGATATALGVVALGGRAAAHFPPGLDVAVKPGSDRSPINPRSNGVTPVAVLGTDEFDPASEAVRYRFGAPDVVEAGGGARPAHAGHVEDVNGDGRPDLVLHFPTAEAGFDGDESEARVEWERTADGHHGRSGTDAVTIVGRP